MTNDNILSGLGIRDINELFAKHHEIAIIWAATDVLVDRPDLTLEQAWEVLQECRDYHDPNEGLTWDILNNVANERFPPPEDAEDPAE